MSVKELINKIKSEDDNTRGDAWQGAGTAGAEAIKPLAGVFAEGKFKIERAAKRAMWKIVRHAGRPGADGEKRAVLKELLPLLGNNPVAVRREVLWMISELSEGSREVSPIAEFLDDKELREDARMVLERIPGEKSLAALKKAFKAVPENFKQNIVQSLRARGVEVDGYPCQKLVPKKKTNVKPVGR